MKVEISSGGLPLKHEGDPEGCKDYIEKMFRVFQDSDQEELNIYIDKEVDE